MPSESLTQEYAEQTNVKKRGVHSKQAVIKKDTTRHDGHSSALKEEPKGVLTEKIETKHDILESENTTPPKMRGAVDLHIGAASNLAETITLTLPSPDSVSSSSSSSMAADSGTDDNLSLICCLG